MKTRLWLTLALCLLAAGCISGGTSPTTPGPAASPTFPPPAPSTPLPDPQPAARAYLDAWKADDYAAMYAALTSLSQDAIAEQTFTAYHREIAATLSLSQVNTEILSVLVKARTAQLGYRVQLATILVGEIARETVMNLSYEGDQWRVQWDASLLLPELAGGNTLWMEYRTPARGNIYDAQSHALVAQSDAVSLGLVAGQTDPAQEDALFDELWQLTGLQPGEIRARLAAYREGWYLPLGEVAASRVEARYPVLDQFSGLVMRPFRARYYFDGGIAPQALGYVSEIQPEEVEAYRRLGYQQDERVGRMGLEKWGEPFLAGARGGVLYVVSPAGKILTKLAETNPLPADALYATLNKDLQVQAQLALEGFRGAIVVLERDTGRVLAIASSPGFDPNLFEPTNYNSEFLRSDLLTDPATPLLNRASQGLYPLGSVFKIITMAAALESGVFTPESTYYCGHTFTEAGSVRYDWTYSHGAPPSGLLTLPEGLMRSCNPWFWHIGLELFEQGFTEAVSNMAGGFGLGQAPGLEPVPEAEGQVPTPATANDAINNAIGQGDTLVTPLQVANFVAAIGNGGNLLRPQLVDRIVSPGGQVKFTFAPQLVRPLPISPETLQTIQAALKSVVDNPRGTAYWQFINFPIPLAGKTGTAEAPPGDPHAWFVGYTYAEKPDQPDIAVAVVLEHAGEGSIVAAPLFKRMLEVYFFGRALSPLPWETSLEAPPPTPAAP